MDNPNTSNAPLEALTCSGPGRQSEELGLSSNKTGDRSASCGTSIFSSTLQKKENYISDDCQMDLDRHIIYCSETLYKMFSPACGSAAAAIVMCAEGFWPVLSLLQVISEIQISFIQAHWHEVGIIVSKNITNLTRDIQTHEHQFSKKKEIEYCIVHVFCSRSHLFTHSSVFVKVEWNNYEVRAEFLCDKARHGCPDPEPPCMVVGCGLLKKKNANRHRSKTFWFRK